MNKKAQRYKKSQAQVVGGTSAQGTFDLGTLVGTLLKQMEEIRARNNILVDAVTDLRAHMDIALKQSRVAEFRSAALVDQLVSQNLLTEENLIERITKFHVNEFNLGSAAHDQQLDLVNADGEVVQEGYYAIVTAEVYDSSGTLQKSNGIVRSKINIGKEELFKGADAGLLGMKVNETKEITVEAGGQSLKLNLTLLGLRKKNEVTQAAAE